MKKSKLLKKIKILQKDNLIMLERLEWQGKELVECMLKIKVLTKLVDARIEFLANKISSIAPTPRQETKTEEMAIKI